MVLYVIIIYLLAVISETHNGNCATYCIGKHYLNNKTLSRGLKCKGLNRTHTHINQFTSVFLSTLNVLFVT